MATIESNIPDAHIVIEAMVRTGMSHESISNYLRCCYPHVSGLSARSVRRFCRTNNITRITNDELDHMVGDMVERYGHGYGRSLMQGSIRALLGVTVGVVSQRRISAALQRIAPLEFEQRTRDILVRTNPIPYYAPYFGYKVHMDQNEKIGPQNFGCTHIALIDGCSRMIVGYASMPVKNPILIYEYVFRKTLIEYGIWNQLRVDHGREFVLCLFVQEVLSVFRYSQEKLPWRQTTSTDNNVIERVWPELNSRVNYPVKRAMIYIQETFDYDPIDPIIKYCFSWMTVYIATDAAKHLIDSWNHHRVPGPNGCVPIDNMRMTKRTVHLEEHLIPSTPEAVRMYEAQGGRLTRDSSFGIDPLISIEHAYESREALFRAQQPSGEQLFSDVVHGQYDSTKEALDHFYNLTNTLFAQFSDH